MTAVLALTVLSAAASGSAPELTSLARVKADAQELAVLSSRFDLAEQGQDGWYDVVLHPGDLARLRELGMKVRILVPDLLAADLRARRAARLAQDQDPTQRLVYRTLADYNADMHALALKAPGLVREFALPYKTHEGRAVSGVEIGGHVEQAATDGRPTSVVLGLHHAREWPSGEVSISFAQDLVHGYLSGNSEIIELLDAVRVLVVPVVNPDGFVRSRESLSDYVVPLPGLAAQVGEFAYHRKNMRKNTPDAIEVGQGVDPNRNYPYWWGGDGSDTSASSQIYHGPGPGSEPEVANVLHLLSTNQVLTLVTNHTYSNLVLRPWGHKKQSSPDEAALRTLGDSMAAQNGYKSEKGIDLYVTTGTTEDWLYGVTGGFGYTFEIGSTGAIGQGNVTPLDDAGFHPQYNLYVPGMYAENRGPFLTLLRAARNAQWHAVLRGDAPAGTTLRLEKDATVPVAPDAEMAPLPAHLVSTMTVGPSGRFVWHVNPSPQPEGAQDTTYALTATLPGGGARTQRVLVRRGESVTVKL